MIEEDRAQDDNHSIERLQFLCFLSQCNMSKDADKIDVPTYSLKVTLSAKSSLILGENKAAFGREGQCMPMYESAIYLFKSIVKEL